MPRKFDAVSGDEVTRIDAAQAAYFDTITEAFDPPYPPGVAERLERIVEAAAIAAGEAVLDVGTGTGALIPGVQAAGAGVVYANDLSPAMLETVAERYPAVTTVLGGIRTLDLPDDVVDVVLINACYPNLTDKRTVFANVTRMLRPGGRVVISHPMGRRILDFLHAEMPFPVDEFPSSRDEAAELFAPFGLTVERYVDEDELYILVLRRD
ncbi:MAG: methyltransferase domain-containing protein [Actinomycetota bacterium]|nr:methyltransferase domain-containing protein [Actinomycetota bacterium]